MVQCKGCGFLSGHTGGSRFVEVDAEFRENPKCGPMPGLVPLCFMRAFDLGGEYWKEYAATAKDVLLSKSRVVNRERDCKLFTPWQQGFTPKEHKKRMIELEEKKYLDERERKDREYRDEQRRKDEEFRTRQSQDEAAWRKKQEWQFVVEIICGVIATALLLCGTQLYCTWWQVTSFQRNEPQSPRPAVQQTTAPVMPSAEP